MRTCGDCQLCCKLLPVRELRKGANEKCKFQKVGKGCTVYNSNLMPPSCRLWNCRWLIDPEDTAELSRPDRSHYVIDALPDYALAQSDDGGEPFKIPVVQVWVDPRFRDAHRDPALRRYLAMLGETLGMAALIRYDASEAFILFPPALTADNQFREHDRNESLGREHTAQEVWDALDAVGLKSQIKVSP